MFPELTFANSPAKYAKEPGRKMSVMLAKLGMHRDGTRVFHSLRHACNNTMIRVTADVFPDGELKRFVRLRIMGHTLGDDVNAKHYTEAKPHELAALMAGMHFDLPDIAPFDIEFGLACVRVALHRKTGERRGTESPLQNPRSPHECWCSGVITDTQNSQFEFQLVSVSGRF